MLALKGAILSVTPPSKRPTRNEDVRVREGAPERELSLSLAARACVRARAHLLPAGLHGGGGGGGGGREPKALNAFFSMQLPSLAERTNERATCHVARLPAACRLPASGSRQLARQPAGGGREERRERGVGLASLLARSLYHFNISER